MKTNIDPVISEYFSKLGKKGGSKNKEKGSEYFSQISKLRKKHGRQKVAENQSEA